MADGSFGGPDHNIGGVDAVRLLSLVQRIEKLEEEKKDISESIKDVYTECKSSGFDNKILRQVVKFRSMEQDKLEEQDHLMALYRRALGV